MRLLDENNNEISESDCDLSIGYIQKETIIRPDAAPIDDVTKFAWDDDDYEEIKRYIVVPENQRVDAQIQQLKRNLNETDYVVIKIAQGVSSEQEYEDVISSRSAWRKRINELQERIKTIANE